MAAKKARVLVGRALFAANLRRFRQARGLSQEALAELSGLHRTFISCIERSEKNVSIDSMERVARALDRELRDFFDERPQ